MLRVAAASAALALSVLGATPPMAAAEPVASTKLRVNSVGFLPAAVKRATVSEVPAGTTGFTVRRLSDDVVVFTGPLGAEQRTAKTDTNELVRVLDFSALRDSGRYALEVPGVGRSAPFTIAAEVWNAPFVAVARGLYLWRCGTAVHGTWQGHTYHQDACHLGDGWLDHVGGGHVARPGTGGWHDAGDYNKYVTNAGVSVGILFKAWEHFRPQLEAVKLDLPESGNATPDLLDELRWELEWLFTMQLADGRVYHKLSSPDFRYWGPAAGDRDPRYFSPWGTMATADFTAMMAMAARHFREFDAAFAERCLAAARLSWRCLEQHPEEVKPDLSAFKTGAYLAGDASRRMWAAAELWATTGEEVFLRDFEQRAATAGFTHEGPTWGNLTDLGLATYLETARPGREAALVQRLTASLLARAAAIVTTVEEHAYGRPLGGERRGWYWGANGTVAGQTLLLHVADRLQPDGRYRAAAEQSLAWVFGRNFHGRSYVTGLGHLPPQHPHDRRGEPAWPGYLVGGGHPTGRDWKDEQGDYAQNEIALNWNAKLIYALGAFVTP